MTEEQDGENGTDEKTQGDSPIFNPGILTWVKTHAHNQDAAASRGGLYCTFIWTSGPSLPVAMTSPEYRDAAPQTRPNVQTVIATGTIAPDDRAVGKGNALPGDGFWGGVNVHRLHRGRGIGKVICRQMDEHIEKYASESSQSLRFHLFTQNEAAIKIYLALGFSEVGLVKTDSGEQRLFAKNYPAFARETAQTAVK